VAGYSEVVPKIVHPENNLSFEKIKITSHENFFILMKMVLHL